MLHVFGFAKTSSQVEGSLVARHFPSPSRRLMGPHGPMAVAGRERSISSPSRGCSQSQSKPGWNQSLTSSPKHEPKLKKICRPKLPFGPFHLFHGLTLACISMLAAQLARFTNRLAIFRTTRPIAGPGNGKGARPLWRACLDETSCRLASEPKMVWPREWAPRRKAPGSPTNGVPTPKLNSSALASAGFVCLDVEQNITTPTPTHLHTCTHFGEASAAKPLASVGPNQIEGPKSAFTLNSGLCETRFGQGSCTARHRVHHRTNPCGSSVELENQHRPSQRQVFVRDRRKCYKRRKGLQ